MNDRVKLLTAIAAIIAIGAVLQHSSGEHPTLATVKSEAPTPERPSFPLTTAQVRNSLFRLPRPWSATPLVEQQRRDSLTGGDMIDLTYRDGMLMIYSLPSGQVWRITLVSGIAEKCGSSAARDAGVKAADQIVAHPSRVTTMDGCLNSAVLTAT